MSESGHNHAMGSGQAGRAPLLALLLTLGYSVVEGLAGWWAGTP